MTVEAGNIARIHEPLARAGVPTWGPSGRLLATSVLQPYSSRYREGTSQLLLFSLDGDADRTVVPVEHRSVGKRQSDGPVWSPDGTMMASSWMVRCTSCRLIRTGNPPVRPVS